MTLPYLPLAFLARPTQGLRKVVLVTFTILCHHLMLSGVAVLVDTIRTLTSSSPGQLWARTTSAWQSAVVFAVVDQAIYGNVLFTLATTCLLPVWTLLYLTLQDLLTLVTLQAEAGHRRGARVLADGPPALHRPHPLAAPLQEAADRVLQKVPGPAAAPAGVGPATEESTRAPPQ